MKPVVFAALQADAELISLLGGKKTYQLRAPDAADFPRITFFEYDNVGAAFADDAEKASEIYIQVDVWCKNASTAEIAARVDAVMKSIGFQRHGAQDLYEDDNNTQIFHKAMRYSSFAECEDINQ